MSFRDVGSPDYLRERDSRVAALAAAARLVSQFVPSVVPFAELERLTAGVADRYAEWIETGDYDGVPAGTAPPPPLPPREGLIDDVEADGVRGETVRLLSLIKDLTDSDNCFLDHHGYCQAHGWFETEPRCPHARAKEVLQDATKGSPS